MSKGNKNEAVRESVKETHTENSLIALIDFAIDVSKGHPLESHIVNHLESAKSFANN